MTKHLALATLLLASASGQVVHTSTVPCSTVVGVLIPQIRYQVPPDRLARVEIRQCRADGIEELQLAAWASDSEEPEIVLNTSDFTIASAAISANTVVVITASRTRNQVYAVQFSKETPILSLHRSSRGRATIMVEYDHIAITVRNTGEGGPETYRFNADGTSEQ